MLRFRPILMTTMAALLGGVPLMLGNGAGSRDPPAARLHDRRRPRAVADLTLFTTPVVYIYLDRLQALIRRRREPAEAASAVA